jgi:hypothetical protein
MIKMTDKYAADYWVKRVNKLFGETWDSKRDAKLRKELFELSNINYRAGKREGRR